LDAGAIGTLLPGGRPLSDPDARAEVERAWGASIPAAPGRDTAGILAAVGIAEPELTDFGVATEAFDAEQHFHGEVDEEVESGLAGLLIGGVEISDLPDPAAALAAVASAGFVVSLEIRASAVTELANVVFPVAAAAEKSGAYVNWEGRVRPFAAALPEAGTLDEARILDTLGVEMDVDLYTQTPAAAAAEIARLGVWSGPRPVAQRFAPIAATDLTPGSGFRLASWRMNLDGGRGLDGEPHLMGTAKPDVVRLSPAAALELGVRHGDPVVVRGAASSMTLPLAVTGMVDDVVWLPAQIDGIATTGRLGAQVGDRLQVQPATAGREQS
jgi:NADH-quinone oxidoreductase subunit G